MAEACFMFSLMILAQWRQIISQLFIFQLRNESFIEASMTANASCSLVMLNLCAVFRKALLVLILVALIRSFSQERQTIQSDSTFALILSMSSTFSSCFFVFLAFCFSDFSGCVVVEISVVCVVVCVCVESCRETEFRFCVFSFCAFVFPCFAHHFFHESDLFSEIVISCPMMMRASEICFPSPCTCGMSQQIPKLIIASKNSKRFQLSFMLFAILSNFQSNLNQFLICYSTRINSFLLSGLSSTLNLKCSFNSARQNLQQTFRHSLILPSGM